MKKIKQIRLEKNFTQEYMASQLLISQSYYAKIEKGKKELTILLIVQLSKIFNINATQLFEEIASEYSIYQKQSTTNT